MRILTLRNLLYGIAVNGLGESILLPTIFNMSITASIIILFVLLARLALKKAPKLFSYLLWSVVLFRLLCPVSFSTDFSLLRLFDTPAMEDTQYTTAMEYIPYDIVHTTQLEFHLPVPRTINEAVNESLPQEHAALGADPLEGEMAIVSFIWLLGVASMAIYSMVSYLLLRKKLIGTVLLRDNIYLADGIDSPFVMGIIRPKIYLPSFLAHKESEYIILHEQHHILRKDHLIKFLSFLALCIHWFNPLVWLAFILSSRDMELSCDEAVLKKLGEEIRYDYSASLLRLATGRRIIAGTPLAFGEGDTKCRIKNMLNRKPPKVWITVSAIIICVFVIAACVGNSPAQTATSPNPPAGTSADPFGNTTAGTASPSSSPTVSSAPSSSQSQTPSSSSAPVANEPSKLLDDIAYHLELAAGKEFKSMSNTTRDEILSEYQELLKDYTLIARESTDGKSIYIIGQYEGASAQNTLHGMYAVEFNDQWGQVLYCEEDSEAIDEALTLWKEPTVGYSIKDSRISWSDDGSLFFIQPQNTQLSLGVAWNRYLYTHNGRAYIADAISRGIDICGGTDTYLYVYRITEEFGELAERIALTEAEAKAILTEERVKITDGFGFSASLHIDGQNTVYFNEREGIPQTVLDLAVERCDYRFGDPSYITDTIREARLDCSWLSEPRYAKAEDLPRLSEILKNAEQGYIGACGYGAILKLTFTGGEKLTVFKGTDGCDSIAFGSYGGYFLGDKENTEFWNIFGLDPDTKEPLL